tara:strand:+ start:156 stop:521 length:366 start_codon:yes stop_codon:yes gene_type:complete
MAFFCKIDENNIVKNIEVVDNSVAPTEEDGIAFLKNLHGEQFNYKQMGSAPFISNGIEVTRNYGGINFTYDENLDLFIEPKVFDSWILDESTGRYHAPEDYPDDGKEYRWNEDTTSWEEIT